MMDDHSAGNRALEIFVKDGYDWCDIFVCVWVDSILIYQPSKVWFLDIKQRITYSHLSRVFIYIVLFLAWHVPTCSVVLITMFIFGLNMCLFNVTMLFFGIQMWFSTLLFLWLCFHYNYDERCFPWDLDQELFKIMCSYGSRFGSQVDCQSFIGRILLMGFSKPLFMLSPLNCLEEFFNTEKFLFFFCFCGLSKSLNLIFLISDFVTLFHF